MEKPEQNPFALEQHYLPHDRLIGVIEDLTPTKSAFKKCQVSVQALLRKKDTIPVRDQCILFVQDESNQLTAYRRCCFQVDLERIKNKNNPGEFDGEQFWNHKGMAYLGFAQADQYVLLDQKKPPFSQVFRDLRAYLSLVLEEHLTGESLGVAKALVLGDRSSLDGETRGKFGNTGAMHVLAVSGLHVGILVQLLSAFLALFSRWITKNKALVIALVLVWIYALMTGFSASVARSAFMFTLLSASTLLGRDYMNYNVLAFSAFILLVINPHYLFDIGFQLSYLAMLGIFMFHHSLSRVWIAPNKPLRLIVEGTMVGVAAQIMTVPLTLYYFHQFPNYFILTNLGLMLFSFLVLALGLVLFLVKFWSFLAQSVAFFLSFSLLGMLFVVDFVDGLPGAVATGFVLPLTVVVALYVVGLACFVALMKQKLSWLYASLLGASVLLLLIVGMRHRQMESDQICFFQSKDLAFVVKVKGQLAVFYANKKGEDKGVRFLAQAYQKVFPGELHFYEISRMKKTKLAIGKNRVHIERQKGGYAVSVNQQNYFLCTTYEFPKQTAQLIYAGWLDVPGQKHQLKRSSFSFEVE